MFDSLTVAITTYCPAAEYSISNSDMYSELREIKYSQLNIFHFHGVYSSGPQAIILCLERGHMMLISTLIFLI